MEIGLVATMVAGLLGGIFFRSFVDLGASFACLFLFFAFTIFFLTWKLGFQVDKRHGVYIALFLLAFSLGIFRYDMVDTKENLLFLDNLAGRTVNVEGIITDEPKEKDKTTTLVVSVSVEDGRQFSVLVLTKPYVKYSYGDRIKIYGKLEKIKNFSEDFDYVAYLAKDEIYYQFLNPKINLVTTGSGSFVQEKLFSFKNSFLDNINSVISEPESSLMGGIILGAKSSMDKELLDEFKKVGLIHIVALSGYNVTVIADNLMKVIWFLPLAVRLGIGSLIIVFFAFMTGGGSTVVRASVMVLLAMLARATGRIYLAGLALLVAATMMIIYDPKILIFDISFQLSFLATAGLIFFTPILEKKLIFVPERFGLRGALVSTLAAQLAVWPLILYKMGNFSLVSIPANLLVGPVVPVAMFFGFVTGFAGYVSYYLSLIFSFVSYSLLFCIIKITEILASFPFASLTILSFPLIATFFIYICYLVIILRNELTP